MNLEPWLLMDLTGANGHLSNIITEAFPGFGIVVYARLCHYYVIAFVFCTAHEQSWIGPSKCFCDPPQCASKGLRHHNYHFCTCTQVFAITSSFNKI